MKKFTIVAVLILGVIVSLLTSCNSSSLPLLQQHEAERDPAIHDAVPGSTKVEIGAKAVIPEWSWVERGQRCGVQFGAWITIKEIRSDGLLVEYTAPDDLETMGTPCDTGDKFIVEKSDFAAMTNQYIAVRDTMKSEFEFVKRQLAKNYYGEVTDAGKWHWVDLVNLDSVTQQFRGSESEILYGDSCGAGRMERDEKGGTIQVRGQENGKVLYEYTASGDPVGTPCPSGVLFTGEESRIGV
jgi:hypothetical protein